MDSNKKILVVEDDETLRNMLLATIKDQGFGAFEARDGEEGLKIALQEHPDVILLDILMPKMNGITFIKEIRKDEWGKNASIIVLTNYNANDKVADVLEAGAHDYIVKSVSLEEVMTRVKEKLKN